MGRAVRDYLFDELFDTVRWACSNWLGGKYVSNQAVENIVTWLYDYDENLVIEDNLTTIYCAYDMLTDKRFILHESKGKNCNEL